MRRKHLALATLSTVTALVSSLVAYASKVQPTDPPVWLSEWLTKQRVSLAVVLLCLAWLAAIIEWMRSVLAERSQNRLLLQRLVDDFAKNQFKSNTRRNRLTLFRVQKGWRCLLRGCLRLPLFQKGHKWRALWRVQLGADYLSVYVRGADSRNVRSATALRISDDPTECEGMAGLVWEESEVILPNMPKIDPAAVRRVTRLLDLPNSDPIRIYAEATRMTDLVLLQSMDHFARHFMGYLIRRSDGTRWGVLLLDSEEQHCPFTLESGGGPFGDRLAETARVLGKIVV